MTTYQDPDYIADDGTRYHPDAYESGGLVYASVSVAGSDKPPLWVTCDDLVQAAWVADRLALMLAAGVIAATGETTNRVAYVHEVTA